MARLLTVVRGQVCNNAIMWEDQMPRPNDETVFDRKFVRLRKRSASGSGLLIWLLSVSHNFVRSKPWERSHCS